MSLLKGHLCAKGELVRLLNTCWLTRPVLMASLCFTSLNKRMGGYIDKAYPRDVAPDYCTTLKKRTVRMLVLFYENSNKLSYLKANKGNFLLYKVSCGTIHLILQASTQNMPCTLLGHSTKDPPTKPLLSKVEMDPDLTQAYFWPAVNKRPTRLWPRYFLTQPEEVFFWSEGKKLKNLTFLGEILQIQTQTINGWPSPGQKFLTRTHHYKGLYSFSFWARQQPKTILLWVFSSILVGLWSFT